MSFLLVFIASLRIISLVPSVTEIIYLLHADSMLVANTIYGDYPAQAKNKPKVGDMLHPKIERILEYHPDYVFVTLPLQGFVSDKLKKLGLKVITVSPESIDGIFETIMKVGKYTGHEARAGFVIDSLKSILDSLKATIPKQRPKLFFELSPRPLYTPGKNSFINDIINIAGAKNIFGDVKMSYLVAKQEDVIRKNPDMIILSYPGADPVQVSKRVGWSEIRAVKRGCISKVKADLFTRPGPRFVDAIKVLRGIILECIPLRKQ